MHTAAVICEFDPLHRGHEYLLSELRRRGAVRIVCILSGAFCQRGEPSAFPKHARARAAIEAGADLVLELPFPYSCASAEFFARGALSIISALGCVDTLGFGCECGDAEALAECAHRMLSEEFSAERARVCAEHRTIGAAAQIELAYKNLYGDASLLSGANNVLALEYIKAAERSGMHPCYCAVKRRGSGHSDMDERDAFASASLIRAKLREGVHGIDAYLPESTVQIFSGEIKKHPCPPSLGKAERAILGHFCLMRGDTADTAELKGGLGGRMADAARRAHSYDEFISMLKTKKYTDARLRRAVIFSMCGVLDTDLRTPPAYTTMLAANGRGIALLSEVKKTLGMPLVSNPAMLGTLSKESCRAQLLCRRAEALRGLCSGDILTADDALRIPPSIVN